VAASLFALNGPPTVSVVIPALAEAENLRLLLPLFPPAFEVVVVEGRRSDHTREIVAAARPSTILVRQTRRGKGNALACGFAVTTGEILVMFDADGSALVEEIPRFVHTLLAGADFAKGTRTRPGGGSEDITRIRRLGNWGFTKFANLLFRTRYSDFCYGYNAFWRRILPALELPPIQPEGERMMWGDGFEIEAAINCRIGRAGLDVREVPSLERARVHGVSNLHAWRDGRRVLWTVLRERLRSAGAAPAEPTSAPEPLPKAG
jgi:glycosyltransferase involved in cell wall biosynthesis